jgi:hypothetical protein
MDVAGSAPTCPIRLRRIAAGMLKFGQFLKNFVPLNVRAVTG